MTETLDQRIRRHEGFAKYPKPDAKGMDVVGYGHDLTPIEAKEYEGGITVAEASALLASDINEAKRELFTTLPWVSDLSPARQDVLTEMVFQLGIDGLMEFGNFLFHLRSGDFVKAAVDMVKSGWHKQTPARCEELANITLNDQPTEEALPWTGS